MTRSDYRIAPPGQGGDPREAADAIADGADRAAILAALRSLLRRTLAP